ncbi:ABC transporter substrate-binding protein [Loigolactobacillus rennini]|uniref:Fe/B12 periplasmic-binding domain-containing protein n=2 Tax=Loigolactobacillus rennini TaxID=238013 RepID=A0A0R2D9Z0_9LACO|nr:ABC transporter substrate-binding protein [Loigolactobacillus rennini]KRM99962.1 hypothetical protein FC24_GL001506 [Loigolactobacillus rennini DSM 20253]SFZ88958.1 Vitamin B12 ABC transporter, B12-binding component BtuF [Loigolactobacillus rennini]
MKKLVKKIALLAAALVMVVGLAACGTNNKSSQKNSAADKTVTITDQADNKVTVPKKIKRIAVAGIYPLPSVISVFFNSADKIVGMPEPSMIAAKNSLLSELYPKILKANTSFNKNDNVNTEELKKLNPDVVFYTAENKKMKKTLENAGFTAVGVSVSKWDYDSVKTLNHWISLLSKLFPENNRAKIVKNYSNDVSQKIQKRVGNLTAEQKQKVFFLFQYDGKSIATSGKHFFGQYWTDAIGAVNAGAGMNTDNSTAVNMEQIYKWDPQVILITNFTKAQPADLYGNKMGSNDWSKIDAVKNKRVYKMPLGMYRSYTPGVDTPVTLWWMAKTVYPEQFKDINITKETKTYYKKVFNIELTDKQADKIFKPSAAASAY